MWKKYLVCMSTFCIISLLCACTNGKVIHPALENTSSTISSEDSIDETVEKPSDAFSSPTDSEQSSNTVDIREIIYLQLPVEKQSMLSPDWQDAQVHTVVLSQSMGYDIDGGYIDQQVYLIEFPYSNHINNLLVYASVDSQRIVGYGFSD